MTDLLGAVDAAFAVTSRGMRQWDDPHDGEMPAEEEYSRCTDPAKWRIMGAQADAWIAGVVVDVGRLQRLFTGAARQAVLMQFPTCIFPGCNRPASRCEADHLTDWRHGGSTNQANGAPLCARHNQLKNHGFTVWRDPNGVFHTDRPDGTEIAPAPPQPGSGPPTIAAAA